MTTTAEKHLKAGIDAEARGDYGTAKRSFLAAGTAADTTREIWREGLAGIARVEEKEATESKYYGRFTRIHP